MVSRSVLSAGTRIGHYVVLAELGRGGMGVVYRARDLRLDREVALKSPWPFEGGAEKNRRRFLIEARAASRLSHPNIVPVFEVFEKDGVPWLVMPLVEGKNARTLVTERGRLPADEVLGLAEDLATALQAAHARSVLHRDVNPNNVLVNDQGHAVLADFGLARILPDRSLGASGPTASAALTETGEVLGTPGFMSPEQALAKPLDARSDLFSLGAVLYYLLTGAMPFPGSGHGEILDAILHREPEPIPRFTYEVPPELERIVRKGMAKRLDERYQSATEMLADLRALRRRVESLSITAPVTAPPPARRRARVYAAAALLAAGAGTGLWLALGPHRPSPPRPAGVSRQVTSAPGWETAPALSSDGSTIAYVSLESGNPDVWTIDVHGGRALRLTDAPGRDGDPAWFPDSSAIAFVSDRGGAAGIWKVGRLGGSATPLVADAEDPAISPDGTRVAFSRLDAGSRRRIFVAALADPGRATRLSGDGDGLWDHRKPAWSPDGKTIAYHDFRSLWRVPAAGGRPARVTEEAAVDRVPVWSADGRALVFGSSREGTQAIWRVPADGGNPVRLTMGTGPESQPSVSRDGARLVYSTYLPQADIVLVDLESGRRSRFGDLRIDDQPAVAPDGRAVAFVSDRGGENGDLWLQPLERGRASGPARRLTDQRGSMSLPSFSPDGRFIACHYAASGRRDIWIVPAEGNQALALTDDAFTDVQPAWSPDGTQVAWSSERDGHAQIWLIGVRDGRRASEPRQLTGDDADDYFPAWSPDGRELAFIRVAGGAADVWTVPADRSGPPRQLTHGADPHRLCWDRSRPSLLASGLWGGAHITLRRIATDTGQVEPFEREVDFGDAESAGQFDLSADGRLLAYAEEQLSGDIWVLESEPGTY